MLSRVDFPQPEGPIMATNSPVLTSKLTLERAVVSTISVRKILDKLTVRIINIVFIHLFQHHAKKLKYLIIKQIEKTGSTGGKNILHILIKKIYIY
jgi:hypothetical protein